MHRARLLLFSAGLVAVAGGLIALLVRTDGNAIPIDVDDVDPSAEDRATTQGPSAVGSPRASSDPSTSAAPPKPALPDGEGTAPFDPSDRWIVSGVVVAATTRTPVPGVSVHITKDRRAENLGSTEGSEARAPETRGPAAAITDAPGAFRLVLDPGSPTKLQFDHPEWQGAVLSIDGSRTDLVVELRPGLTIAGRVVTRGGAGLEGVTVLAPPTAGLSPAERLEGVVRTDRDGRFRVKVDSTKSGVLLVSHPIHVGRIVRFDPAARGDLQIELSPALVVWVRLRTSDGRPVDRAQVLWTSGTGSGQGVLGAGGPSLDRPPPPGGGLGPLELPLDASGTPISVRLTVPGYAPHTGEWAAASPDGDTRTLDVTLARDPGAATVSLRLERADGSSLPFDPDVPLTVERTDGGTVPAFSVASDRGEAATIDGLPAGPYRFRAWLPGSGPAEADVVAVAGTTVGAVARATVEARLTLRLTGTSGRRGLVRVLSGGRTTYPQVVDDPRGTAALQRAVVSGVVSTVLLLGEDGVTLGGFGAGPHRVEVVSPDLTGAPVEVDLKAGETARADVVGRIR